MKRLGVLLAAVALASLPLSAEAVGPPPRVVVTVKPIHALVAAVMEGVGRPELLLGGAASPHAYSLRPSEAASLARAQVVFWVGESLETFLARPLAALASGATVVELGRAPGMTLLEGREGGVWEGHANAAGRGEEGGGKGRDHGDHGRGMADGHLWLDPGNARAIVEAAAAALERADPAHRDRYRENAGRAAARIEALDTELAARLAPVRTVPYVVFHDAYQYFERRYGLRAVGAISVSPDRGPGAKRLAEVRGRIRALGARCVFSEPQFEPRLVATLLEGTAAGSAVLDPLGAAVPEGPDAWFTLMRNLAGALAGCLSAP